MRWRFFCPCCHADLVRDSDLWSCECRAVRIFPNATTQLNESNRWEWCLFFSCASGPVRMTVCGNEIEVVVGRPGSNLYRKETFNLGETGDMVQRVFDGLSILWVMAS